MCVALSLPLIPASVWSSPIVWAATITFIGVLLTVIVGTTANFRLAKRRNSFEQALAQERRNTDLELSERKLADELLARREARGLSIRLKQIDFQRETLVELQEQMHDLVRAADAVSRIKVIGEVPSPEILERMRAKNARTALLVSRVADLQIRDDVAAIKKDLNPIKEGDNKTIMGLLDRGTTRFAALIDTIGARIRQLDQEELDEVSSET